MKSKQYGFLTVLIPEEEQSANDNLAASACPIQRKTVYQVRVDDEAYLEFSMERQDTPRGNELSVAVYARKTGNPDRIIIGAVYESRFKSLGIDPSKELTDDVIMNIRDMIMGEEQLFWDFFQSKFRPETKESRNGK